MKHRLTLILICALSAAGCSHKPRKPAKPAQPPAKPAASRGPQEEPYALRVNRTLIYPVEWGRAADLAETLRPLLVGRYGPDARVVVHEETNQLLIYLPPRSANRPHP